MEHSFRFSQNSWSPELIHDPLPLLGVAAILLRWCFSVCFAKIRRPGPKGCAHRSNRRSCAHPVSLPLIAFMIATDTTNVKLRSLGRRDSVLGLSPSTDGCQSCPVWQKISIMSCYSTTNLLVTAPRDHPLPSKPLH